MNEEKELVTRYFYHIGRLSDSDVNNDMESGVYKAKGYFEYDSINQERFVVEFPDGRQKAFFNFYENIEEVTKDFNSMALANGLCCLERAINLIRSIKLPVKEI